MKNEVTSTVNLLAVVAMLFVLSFDAQSYEESRLKSATLVLLFLLVTLVSLPDLFFGEYEE